jgi:hypothetical protein
MPKSDPLWTALSQAKAHLDGFLFEARKISDLSDAIDKRMESGHAAKHLPDAATAVRKALDQHSNSLQRMVAAVEGFVADRMFISDDAKPHGGHWNDYLLLLERAFVEAVATANTDRLGHGEGGPLVAFIAAIIPRLSDEHPKPGNIAKQLKDRRAPDPLIEEVIARALSWS